MGSVTQLPVPRPPNIFEPKAFEVAAQLEQAGLITVNSFDLDPNLSIDEWALLGGYFGKVHDSTRWWLGDWVNWGEEAFGHDASQYFDEDGRFLGLSGRTVVEYARVCARVAKSRRRPELTFSHHREVCPLEAPQQDEWLARAVEEDWNRDQLRTQIRDALAPPGDDGKQTVLPAEPQEDVLLAAALRVWHQGQPKKGEHAVVPWDAWVQLGSAIGELD